MISLWAFNGSSSSCRTTFSPRKALEAWTINICRSGSWATHWMQEIPMPLALSFQSIHWVLRLNVGSQATTAGKHFKSIDTRGFLLLTVIDKDMSGVCRCYCHTLSYTNIGGMKYWCIPTQDPLAFDITLCELKTASRTLSTSCGKIHFELAGSCHFSWW